MIHSRVVQQCLLLAGLNGLILSIATPLSARPYPDKVGVCYFFRAETLSLKQACIVSTGYGAGGHYAGLQWNDGVLTRIVKVNYCPQRNTDRAGFCRYTVDDVEAVQYYRDVFLKPTTLKDEQAIPCYRVRQTGNSTCYSLN